MSQKRTAILLFAVAMITLFAGLIIGSSTQMTVTQLLTTAEQQATTINQQVTQTATTTIFNQQSANLATVTVQGPGGLTEYCFSSGYGTTADCAGLIVKYVDAAKVSVHVLIYSFTLSYVANALIEAKNRGVDVKVVMDRTQASQSSSQYQALVNGGVQVELSRHVYEMHDKVAVIDGHFILTGSFNWSNAANLENDENIVVLDSQVWGSAFEQEFQVIWQASA